MKFSYRAIDAEGKIVSGEIVSDDSRAVSRQIKSQGLKPLEVAELTQTERRRRRGTKRNASSEDKLLMMNQLATLLKSGIPLDEAVTALFESAYHPQLEDGLEVMGTELRRGGSFTVALKTAEFALPDYIYRLSEAGEMTGSLATALEQGVRQMEEDLRLRNEMRNALIYPSILIISGIAAVMLIFTLVVPKFVNLLDKSNTDIPWLASAVLNTGKFMNDNLLAVTLVALAAVGGVIVGLRNQDTRRKLMDFLQTKPVIGEWLTQADIGRWSALLATLLASRVELIQALELACNGVMSLRLQARLNQVSKSVRAGKHLADALKDTGAITATGYGMIKVGERSGELPSMLRSLSEMYQESGRNRMKRFLTLLEPVAILLIGSVIGVIMTGIILAITSVNDISI